MLVRSPKKLSAATGQSTGRADADLADLETGAESTPRNTGTDGYLSFGSMAQGVVHALKGLAFRARVNPASSPASHCKQRSALTSPALHARGCASPSRAH